MHLAYKSHYPGIFGRSAKIRSSKATTSSNSSGQQKTGVVVKIVFGYFVQTQSCAFRYTESSDLCTHRYGLYATRTVDCQSNCTKCPDEIILRVMPESTPMQFLSSSGDLVVRGSDRFSV